MSWELDLASSAQRALRAMPTRDRERIIRALADMKTDPLTGDITRAARKYRGLTGVASARGAFFALKTDRRAVLVGDIVRRTSTTY